MFWTQRNSPLAVLACALLGAAALSTPPAVAGPTPILHLPLDEASARCTFTDSSGNSHTGTVSTGTCPSVRPPGVFFRAAFFDGVNDNIQVAGAPSLDFGTSQDFTVTLWMRSTNPGAWGGMVGTKAWWGGSTAGYILSIDSAGTRWTVNAADGTHRTDAYSSGPVLTDHSWHHLAVTFARSGLMTMYQDGAVVGSAPMAGVGSVNGGGPISIGKVNATEYPYGGLLDDVMLFDRVLTQAEIASLMTCACTVTDGADSGPDTLRGKLADSTCQTIDFSGDFTVSLASTLLVPRSVYIDGGAHTIVLDGNSSVRVLDVSGDWVDLWNLTVRNGRVSTCSTLADNGAGIRNHGGYTYMRLVRTTVSGSTNVSCWGGGLWAEDHATILIDQSTFSGNHGLWGGGFYCQLCDATIGNSTFANNSAGTGGALFHEGSGTMEVRSCSLAGNSASASATAGGGFYKRNAEGTVTFLSSFIVGSPSGGSCGDSGNPLSGATASNLADDSSCGAGFTQSSTVAPGPLASNGGRTQTMALGAGSSAINAGSAADCNGGPDQRGMARRSGFCDIGAFEAQPAVLTATGGTPQLALAGASFASPLEATAKDDAANLLGGVVVTFTPPASGASAVLTGSPATTAATGKASVTATANATLGSYSVVASAGSATPASFTLQNWSGTPVELVTFTVE